jgi:hypothetical protein
VFRGPEALKWGYPSIPNASQRVLARRVFEAVTLDQVGNGLPHVVKAFLRDYLRIPTHCVHQINLLSSIGHFVENCIRVISPRDVDSRLDESLPGDDAGWLSGDWIALHRKSMTRRHSRTQVTEVTQHEMVLEPEPESCRKQHCVQRAFGAVDAGDTICADPSCESVLVRATGGSTVDIRHLG